jgi:Glycosyl transferase family 2
MIRVSAIIPTHNRVRHVGEAVESVLAQTVPCHEVIVVNDGSTDGTRDVLARYGNRIRVICQANRGVSEARNTGLAAATGNWVAFLDSDDVWRPEKLACQLAALSQFPGCAACFTDATYGGRTEHDLVTAFSLAGKRYATDVALEADIARLFFSTGRYFLYIQAALVRRDIAARLEFDPAMRVREDMDFIFRLALTTPICLVSRPLVVIDRTPQRTRLTAGGPSHPTTLTAAQHMYEKWMRLPIPPELHPHIARQLSHVHRAWTAHYLSTGQFPEARRAARAALRLSPEPKAILKWMLTCLAPRFTRALVCRHDSPVPLPEGRPQPDRRRTR